MGTLIPTLAVTLFLTSCMSHPSPHRIQEPYTERQQEVTQRIRQIFLWAKDRNIAALERSHLETPKFTKFDTVGLDLLDFAQTQAYEKLAFTDDVREFRFDPAKTIENLKVSVYGDLAVAAFLFHYDATLADGVDFKKTLRATLVFLRTAPGQDGWKIVHEHFSTPMEL